jgi:hypothetical protein
MKSTIVSPCLQRADQLVDLAAGAERLGVVQLAHRVAAQVACESKS